MPNIFISYRRDDSEGYAGNLYSHLTFDYYEKADIFRDRNDIRPGDNWKEKVDQALGSCQIVLFVIGPRWLIVLDEKNQNRLINSSEVDWIEYEYSKAVERKLQIIPLLMGGADKPKLENLPFSLKSIFDLQFIKIAEGDQFEHDIDYLKQIISGGKGKMGVSYRNPMITLSDLIPGKLTPNFFHSKEGIIDPYSVETDGIFHGTADFRIFIDDRLVGKFESLYQQNFDQITRSIAYGGGVGSSYKLNHELVETVEAGEDHNLRVECGVVIQRPSLPLIRDGYDRNKHINLKAEINRIKIPSGSTRRFHLQIRRSSPKKSEYELLIVPIDKIR